MEHSTNLRTRFGNIAAITGSLVWAFWVIIDYLALHPDLVNSLSNRPYGGLLTGLTIFGGGLSYLGYRKLKQQQSGWEIRYRGLYIYLIVQLFAAIILATFINTSYIPSLPTFSRLSYFFFFSTTFLSGLLAIVTLSGVIGQKMLSPLRSHLGTHHSLTSIALGISVAGTVFMLLAWAGLLKIFIVWPLLVAVLAWQWKVTFQFLKSLLWDVKTLDIRRWWTPLILVFIFALVGFNLVGAFKTFPIGYDGAGLYVNLAEITAINGKLPQGNAAFNWSVFMATGQVMLGSRIASILLSHLMGIFCLLIIYRIGRSWLSQAYALLAALLVFSTPYFAFHTLVDEKIDLALTFLTLSTLWLMLDISSKQNFETLKNIKLKLLFGKISSNALVYALILIGWLCGYIFGVKYTSLFFLFGVLSWLAVKLGDKQLLLGTCLIMLGSILIFNIYRFGLLDIERSNALIGGGLSLISGLAVVILYYRRSNVDIKILGSSLAVLLLFFGLAFSPWAIKNLSEHGSLSIGHLMEGRSAAPQLERNTTEQTSSLELAPPTFGQFIKQSGEEQIPAEDSNRRAKEDTNQKSEGQDAEIRRYFGFESGFWLFSSLPYDVNMNTNVRGSRYVEPGFFLFLFFPLLLLFTPGPGRKLFVQIPLLFLFLLWMGTNYLAVYAPFAPLDHTAVKAKMASDFSQHPGGNTSWFYTLHDTWFSIELGLANLCEPIYSLGTYATPLLSIVLMISISGLLYYLLHPRLKRMTGSLKTTGLISLVYLFFWWLMGSGVLWYAMPIFVLLPVIGCWWLERPDEFMGKTGAKFSRIFLAVTVGLALSGNMLQYFTSSFPGDPTKDGIYRWPFVDYASNPQSREKQIFDAFNPTLVTSMKFMNADMNDYIYQVNTHYGFLIKNNDRRVYKDPTLDKFAETTSRFEDKSVFFEILKQQGYKYIFFDLKTGISDQSPEKNLQKKFIELATALTTSDKIKLITTDNMVADPNAASVRLPNGQVVNARQGLLGQTVSLGNIALFEIR